MRRRAVAQATDESVSAQANLQREFGDWHPAGLHRLCAACTVPAQAWTGHSSVREQNLHLAASATRANCGIGTNRGTIGVCALPICNVEGEQAIRKATNKQKIMLHAEPRDDPTRNLTGRIRCEPALRKHFRTREIMVRDRRLHSRVRPRHWAQTRHLGKTSKSATVPD